MKLAAKTVRYCHSIYVMARCGYGKASFEFANGKPMELLSGSNLLFLLKEHAGLEAKIVVPDYWQDPHADH